MKMILKFCMLKLMRIVVGFGNLLNKWDNQWIELFNNVIKEVVEN